MMRAFVAVLCLALAMSAKSQTLAVKDSTGVVVGFYAGPGAINGEPTYQGLLRVVTSTGYATIVNVNLGEVVNPVLARGVGADGGNWLPRLWFQTDNCTGQAYATNTADTASQSVGSVGLTGVIIRMRDTSNDLWYVPKGALPSTSSGLGTPIQSVRFESGLCSTFTSLSNMTLIYPAFPNDPGVTGYPNVPFVPPLSIEPVPVSAIFTIFQDGFESPQASLVLDREISIRPRHLLVS